MSVSTGVVHRRVSSGDVRRVTTYMKPLLTAKHRIQRLEFALSKVDPTSLLFDDMYDIVMIDEKSFYQSTDKKSYYLAKDEEVPRRACQNKRHIGNSMFLCAVAKPR